MAYELVKNQRMFGRKREKKETKRVITREKTSKLNLNCS
jgi:hypothetical protein